MNRHFNNHGVSQVIAALLLIAIAVAAAILLYVFAIGLLGSLGSGGGQQTKEQLIMEAYNWDTSGGLPGDLTLTVRDVGPSAIDVGSADVFVNGVLQADVSASCSTMTPAGPACAFTFTVDDGGTTLTAGAAYPLKIVTPSGGVFSYSVIAGGSS
jgi:FlaG/FlaF family flagellin (archaellin)